MDDRDSFGCTAQQYHAGLDKLWAAMPQYTKPTDEDVFTLAAAEIVRLRDALAEIALGEGVFSRDPLEHAGNCIDNMIRLAQDALSAKGGG